MIKNLGLFLFVLVIFSSVPLYASDGATEGQSVQPAAPVEAPKVVVPEAAAPLEPAASPPPTAPPAPEAPKAAPPPPPGPKISAKMPAKMQETYNAFKADYAEFGKDGKYPPGMWADAWKALNKSQETPTVAQVKELLASPIYSGLQSEKEDEKLRASENFEKSLKIINEFEAAHDTVGTPASYAANSDKLFLWYSYFTNKNYIVFARNLKAITWPEAVDGNITQEQYDTLMDQLKILVDRARGDLISQLDSAAKKAADAAKAAAQAERRGKFKFAPDSISPDLDTLFSDEFFRGLIYQHYSAFLVKDEKQYKAMGGMLFSALYTQILSQFVLDSTQQKSVTDPMGAKIIAEIQRLGILTTADLQTKLGDEAAQKTFMDFLDGLMRDILDTNGIPAVKPNAPAPTVDAARPSRSTDLVLLYARQTALNEALKPFLQGVIKAMESAGFTDEDLQAGASVPSGTPLKPVKASDMKELTVLFEKSALREALVKRIKEALSIAMPAQVTLQTFQEGSETLIGYDVWLDGNPSGSDLTAKKVQSEKLIATYHAGVVAYMEKKRNFPPTRDALDTFAYRELVMPVTEEMKDRLAQLLFERIIEVMKEHKLEYQRIVSSTSAKRLLYPAVAQVKLITNKLFPPVNKKFDGATGMKAEVQPFVEQMIAAMLLQYKWQLEANNPAPAVAAKPVAAPGA